MNEQVWLAAPFDRLWAGRDPFEAVEALRGEVFRELEARRTLRTEVDGRGYFVKIHRGVGWAEIVKNLVCLRAPVLGAGNEYRARRRVAELGVDSMTPVAFAERGANPAQQHSFIITEELVNTVSLEDYCRDWSVNPPAPNWKRALIGRVAEMAGKMHRGGVNHRDFYICHFLLHRHPSPRPEDFRLSLIDLHRAQIRSNTPKRWLYKDLASLYFSALDIGLTRRDRLRFLAGYFQRPWRAVLREQRHLLDYLEREAQHLLARYRRKYAPGRNA